MGEVMGMIGELEVSYASEITVSAPRFGVRYLRWLV
jgi:hypothetical protein